LSVIFLSFANSIENKKTNTNGLIDGEARQKKIPARTLPKE
jgi:hypothetical protein